MQWLRLELPFPTRSLSAQERMVERVIPVSRDIEEKFSPEASSASTCSTRSESYTEVDLCVGDAKFATARINCLPDQTALE
jgi:hypothetical protein